MSKKFDKNRSVDWSYYHVPLKYLLKFKGGANCDRAVKYREETYEEWKKGMLEWYAKSGWYDTQEEIDKAVTKEVFEAVKKQQKEWGHEPKQILVDKSRDKTLCIIEKKKKKRALVAFRNNNTCKIGIPKICPIIVKKGKWYIRYKDKDILFSDDSGWVF